MSIADLGPVQSGTLSGISVAAADSAQAPMLHRLSTVRRLQSVSQRNVARKLGVDMATVRSQECETNDILLSTLYAWQKVLEVPVAELLVDSDAALSPPVLARAQIVRLMKTAVAILEKSTTTELQYLADSLVKQILEIAPELKSVGSWHQHVQ